MASTAPGPFLYQAEAAVDAGDLAAADELYSAIAASGDARAWAPLGDLRLGVAAESGSGAAPGVEELYRLGAEADDPIAAVRLGDVRAGAGDPSEALRWYERAADLGLALGASRAGRLLWSDGVASPEDAAAAEQLFRRAVALGKDLDALLGLAEIELARDAPVAAVGHAIRAALIARHRLVGTDVGELEYQPVDVDPSTADVAHRLEAAMDLVNEYRMETTAAAEAGDPEACWHWGRIEQLGFGQLADPEEGEIWIQRAADAGHPDALLALARRDRQNGNVESFEVRLRAAAAAGLPAALHDLAFALYSGAFGASPDVDAAIEAYRAAAGPDQPTTATDLSFVLEDQPGPEAAQESVRWLRVAGDAGDAAAMRRLGERYRDGEGVDKDLSASLTWFMSAYYAGWADGLETLRSVADGLDPDVIVAADRDAGGSGRAAALLLGLEAG